MYRNPETPDGDPEKYTIVNTFPSFNAWKPPPKKRD
jgi:hypothetical protein